MERLPPGRKDSPEGAWLDLLADRYEQQGSKAHSRMRGQYYESEVNRFTVRLMNAIFDELSGLVHGLNTRIRRSDNLINVEAPQFHDKQSRETESDWLTARNHFWYEGHISTNLHALLLRGEHNTINCFIIPSNLILGFEFNAFEQGDFKPVLTIEIDNENNNRYAVRWKSEGPDYGVNSITAINPMSKRLIELLIEADKRSDDLPSAYTTKSRLEHFADGINVTRRLTGIATALTILVCSSMPADLSKTEDLYFGKENSQIELSMAKAWKEYCLGDYSSAESKLKKLLPRFIDKTGQRAVICNNLGAIQAKRGRFKEAESRYKEALAAYRKELPADHPYITIAENNLAVLYFRLGKYEYSKPLLEEVLLRAKQQFGPDHAATAKVLNNLAALNSKLKNYGTAKDQMIQALAILEKFNARDSIEYATYMTNLGAINVLSGNLPEADTLLRGALNIKRRQLVSTHPEIAQSLHCLGRLRFKQNRLPEAETLFKQALSIRRKSLGVGSIEEADSLQGLGQVYLSERRFDEAAAAFKNALQIRQLKLFPEHDDIRISHDSLKNATGTKEPLSAAQP